MLGLPASVKAPALAATGGRATYSTLPYGANKNIYKVCNLNVPINDKRKNKVCVEILRMGIDRFKSGKTCEFFMSKEKVASMMISLSLY